MIPYLNSFFCSLSSLQDTIKEKLFVWLLVVQYSICNHNNFGFKVNISIIVMPQYDYEIDESSDTKA